LGPSSSTSRQLYSCICNTNKINNNNNCPTIIVPSRVTLRNLYFLSAAAKEQNMRDHADQTTAFLNGIGTTYKGPQLTDTSGGRGADYKYKSNGTHHPSCAGSCGAPGMQSNGRTALCEGGDNNCMQLRSSGKKVFILLCLLNIRNC